MHFDSFFPYADEIRRATSIADPRLGSPTNVGVEGEEIGNAVGFGEAPYRAALGELAERRHFAGGVPVDSIGSIGEVDAPDLREALRKALAQTSGMAVEQMDAMRIGFTRCRRLGGLDSASLPHCLISLGRPGNRSNGELLPARDTSGCAVHCTPGEAIAGALREFVERQTLLAAWMSREAATELEGLDRIVASLRGAAGAWRLLSEIGKVTCFRLDAGLHAPVVFCMFEAASADAAVQFACGMGSHWSGAAALEKGILELWHTFVSTPIKMKEADRPNSRLHRLDKHFLTFNHTGARARVRLIGPAVERIDAEAYLSQRDVRQDEVVERVLAVSREVYVYSGVEPMGSQLLIAARVVSPDFFLHVDPSRSLNVVNAFTKRLKICGDAIDRSPTCLP